MYRKWAETKHHVEKSYLFTVTPEM